jgi:hypothetical protein
MGQRRVFMGLGPCGLDRGFDLAPCRGAIMPKAYIEKVGEEEFRKKRRWD